MDSLSEFVSEHKFAIGCATFCIVSGIVGVKWIRRKKPRVCGVDYPRDMVMVYGMRGTKGPELGHFAMKLKTYLRANKIPHKPVSFDKAVAPKGKIPFIEYNGVTMGDSQLIIEFLNKELNINMNGHLNEEQVATAWAIQKWIEEFTYFLNVHSRWLIFGDDMFTNYQNLIPRIMKPIVLRGLKKAMTTVGVGRHTDEEIQQMVMNDLRYFSTILGKKPYIMGDRISEVDCAAFGILSQIRWQTPDADIGKTLLMSGELQNVSDYLDRIRNQYWPDWDSICAK